MPGARAGPTLYTWDKRSLLSLVKSALLFMVSLESLLSHFNNYDKNRTFGCVSPVTLARLEASRGQEPHVLFSVHPRSSALKMGIRGKNGETQDSKSIVQLWSWNLVWYWKSCPVPATDKGLIASPSLLLCRTGRLLPSSGRPGGRVQMTHLARAWHRAELMVDGSCLLSLEAG